MEVKVLTNLAEIESYQKIWQSLYLHCDNYFLAPEWHYGWLRNHNPQNLLMQIYLVNQEVVGILPLYEHSNTIYYFSAGDHYALCPEYLDVIYEPSFRSKIEEIAVTWMMNPPFKNKKLKFDYVSANSLLSDILDELNLLRVERESYQIYLPNEGLNEELSKRNRRIFRQKKIVDHYISRDKEYLDLLIHLHEERFTDRSLIFKNSCNISLLKELLQSDNCILTLIEYKNGRDGQRAISSHVKDKICSDSIVAVFMYLKARTHFQFYQSGIRIDKVRSPGILNHLLTSEKLNVPIDLLAGDEAYKLDLSNGTRKLYNYTSRETLMDLSSKILKKCMGLFNLNKWRLSS